MGGLKKERIALVLAAGLHTVTAADAVAQSPAERRAGSCFEIIAPQRHAEPASPILVDKCTGKTWLLVRDEVGRRLPRRLAYRWVSLAIEEEPPREAGAKAARPAASAAPAVAPLAGRNCFEFSGRRYCE